MTSYYYLFLFLSFPSFITIIFSKNTSLEKALQAISSDSLKKHVHFLGSDSLEGRGTGTRGGEIAARYIAQHLKMYGLRAVGDRGTYFQSIPMHGSIPLPKSRLSLYKDKEQFDFELGRDYLLYKSGAQTFIPQPVPLVFVGYGIIAPEFDYNDYQSLNVEGKIVVFLSGEPPSNDPDYFEGQNPSIYAYAESKQRIAISRGARGSILIPSPREQQERSWEYWINTFAFEDVTLAYSVTGNLSIIMNPDAAQRLFDRAAFDLYQVFEMDNAHTIRSFPLNVMLSFKGEFLEREFFASNVIGMIEGSKQKPNDSYIILSAHYDHLGIGRSVMGDSIYNGVFDNAVGVAGVLEIARVFSKTPHLPLHSMIFLFTTGEEKGLLGSTYYVDHPVVPLYKTIAAINVDGLAMIDTFNDIVGIGAELSTINEHLQKVASTLGLTVSPVPTQFSTSESFARSDQIAFAKAGIPTILIAEGYHYTHLSHEEGIQKMIEWNQRIYHTPFDDLNQPMNFEATRQHAQVIFAFCHSLAHNPIPPEWKPGTPFINARLRAIAEKR